MCYSLKHDIFDTEKNASLLENIYSPENIVRYSYVMLNSRQIF